MSTPTSVEVVKNMSAGNTAETAVTAF